MDLLPHTSTSTALPPKTTTPDQTFPLENLPKELRDKIWDTALGLDGPPIIQCVEIDLLQGRLDAEDWFEDPHVPALFPPTYRRGGRDTFNASHYLHERNVARADREAGFSLERLKRTLRLKHGDDILELEAECQPEQALDPVVSKATVWLNTRRDVLLLQTPNFIALHHVSLGSLAVNWFSLKGLERWWSWNFSFHPLPFFGLDQVERLAIDWQVETTRRSIRRSCGFGFCELLRIAYNVELYRTLPEDRKYCTECLADVLERLNRAVQERVINMMDLEDILVDDFRIRPQATGSTLTEEKLGLDERGTFTCQRCNGYFPCAAGRLGNVVAEAPYDTTEIYGWQPKCLHWHAPEIHSDLETLLMGRMPSLKTFYIVDTSIKFKEPAPEAALLCRPREVFEGNNCRFVEVDPREAAWDLNTEQFPRYDATHAPCPFTSFNFAHRLRQVAWQFECCQHAKAQMEEQRANDDPLFDWDEWPLGGAWGPAEVDLEKQELDKPTEQSFEVMAQMIDLQCPSMALSRL